MKNLKEFKYNILFILLFFFTCFLTINEVKADNLDLTFKANPGNRCVVAKSNSNNLKPNLNSLYIKDYYAIFTSVDGGKYYAGYLNMSGNCSLVQMNGTGINGLGSDITSDGSKYYTLAGNSKTIKAFSINRGQISIESSNITGNMTYTGLAYDSTNKRFIGYSNNNLYSISQLTNKPSLIGATFTSNGAGKKITQKAIDVSGNNIYVLKQEGTNGESYVLVYNLSTGAYKYAIIIPKTSNYAINGLKVIDDTMYLGATDGSKVVVLQQTGLNGYERQFINYGTKIIDVKLVAKKPVVIPEHGQFDFSNLYVNITHLNGTVEEIKLTSANTTVNGFNSSQLGKQIVSLSYQGYSFNLEIEVVGTVVNVQSISFNKAQTTLKTGGSEKVTVNINPKEASNKALTWSSNNPGVATISNDGVIKAISPGEATITATSVDGGKTATMKVTVIERKESDPNPNPNPVPETLPEGVEIANVELDVKKPIIIGKYNDFDYENLYIKITYTNNEVEEIKLTEENCEITGFDNERIGPQTVTVKYEEYEFDFIVTVNALERKPKEETEKKVEPEPEKAAIASSNKGLRSLIIFIAIISALLIGVLIFFIIKNSLLKSK